MPQGVRVRVPPFAPCSKGKEPRCVGRLITGLGIVPTSWYGRESSPTSAVEMRHGAVNDRIGITPRAEGAPGCVAADRSRAAFARCYLAATASHCERHRDGRAPRFAAGLQASGAGSCKGIRSIKFMSRQQLFHGERSKMVAIK